MSTVVQKAPTAARFGLGAIFFVFGLNGFLHFIAQPPPSGTALTFLGGLMAAGYFFPLLKGIEVISGLLLLSNRFVPLALTLLAPIVVNILAFHAFLAPSGLPVALAVLALELYLAWSYRDAYRPMLRARVAPAKSDDRAPAREPAHAH
jgi:hypothetical protein